MKTVSVSEQLLPLLEQMSRDMAVPVDGLVNQALFNWARLHGYVEPSGAPVATTSSTASTSTTAALNPNEPSHLSDAPMPALNLGAEPVAKKTPAKDLHAEPVTNPVIHTTPEPDFSADMTVPSMKKMQRAVLIVNDRETPINADRFVIGRDVSCNMTIDAPRISRQHAVLTPHRDFVELEDLNSSNGTWMNGDRISKVELRDGDEFFLGDVQMQIQFR
ncbi:MAG: FHA domain-containing protein [Myxococcaceae bacterium]